MKDVVQFLEAAAAFEPEAPIAVSKHLREAASRQTSSFEDPFCSNPFSPAPTQAYTLLAPLSKGLPGRSGYLSISAQMSVCSPL